MNTKPQLGWVDRLYEVGAPIRRQSEDELELIRVVLAAERNLQRHRREVVAKVRRLWSAEEIRDAKRKAREQQEGEHRAARG